MSAHAYIPFAGVSLASYEFFLERVPVGPHLADELERWKAMRRDGFDVTALLAPDGRTVVGAGIRYEYPERNDAA